MRWELHRLALVVATIDAIVIAVSVALAAALGEFTRTAISNLVAVSGGLLVLVAVVTGGVLRRLSMGSGMTGIDLTLIWQEQMVLEEESRSGRLHSEMRKRWRRSTVLALASVSLLIAAAVIA